MIKKIIGIIYYIFVLLFAFYCYKDLQALFWKSGNDFPVVLGTFSFTTTPMSLLWLLAAILFIIFMPKLWKKLKLLKIPAKTVMFLSIGYIVGFIMEVVQL